MPGGPPGCASVIYKGTQAGGGPSERATATARAPIEAGLIDDHEHSSMDAPTLLQPARVIDPWMVGEPDAGVVFWAPASGTTTAHSTHPRTELGSLTNFKGGQEAHTLRWSVSIQQVPQDGQGIIGQIHGAAGISSAPAPPRSTNSIRSVNRWPSPTPRSRPTLSAAPPRRGTMDILCRRGPGRHRPTRAGPGRRTARPGMRRTRVETELGHLGQFPAEGCVPGSVVHSTAVRAAPGSRAPGSALPRGGGSARCWVPVPMGGA